MLLTDTGTCVFTNRGILTTGEKQSSGNMEPVSAFAVYAKRKNTDVAEQLSKKRKKQKSFRASNKDQKDKAMQISGNQSMRSKERVKSVKKLEDVDNRVSSKANNMQNMDVEQLKLLALVDGKKWSKNIRMGDIKENKKLLRKARNSQNNLNNTKLNPTSDANNTKSNPTSDANNTKSNPTSDANNIKSNPTSGLNNTDFELQFLTNDPKKICYQVFQWMIYPIHVSKTFFRKNWESTPLCVKRGKPDYFKHLFSSCQFDEILRNNNVMFTKNIDVTSYSDGVRTTHNPPGRALPSVVWDYYRNECSVRLLNPQVFVPKIHALCATLQEFFNCFVGANLYLTPPNSQGFAPHYDDVEVFVLQLEGQKRWKLYKPLNKYGFLPRHSSRDFKQSEVGDPLLDTVIKAGDMLYLPRGTIHQAMTFENTHSLHITISVYQKNSWCDFLKKLLLEGLERATRLDVRFRQGMPLDYLSYLGEAYIADNHDSSRPFKAKVMKMLNLLQNYIHIDDTADLMAIDHIHDFLPPYIFKPEQMCTVMEDGDFMTDGFVHNRTTFTLETKIRLVRSHCIRLIREPHDKHKIYYSTENSKEYHEYELQYLEVRRRHVPVIKHLIKTFPNFIYLASLPILDPDEKIQIVKDLWERCLIITERPLCSTANK